MKKLWARSLFEQPTTEGMGIEVHLASEVEAALAEKDAEIKQREEARDRYCRAWEQAEDENERLTVQLAEKDEEIRRLTVNAGSGIYKLRERDASLIAANRNMRLLAHELSKARDQLAAARAEVERLNQAWKEHLLFHGCPGGLVAPDVDP